MSAALLAALALLGKDVVLQPTNTVDVAVTGCRSEAVLYVNGCRRASAMPSGGGFAVFPEDDGLWRVDLKTGEAKLLVGCAALKDMVPPVPETGLSYICHAVVSKDMKRIYFLSRSVSQSMEGVKKFKGVNWHTTAFTCTADGTEVRRCFPDGWGSSHFNWKPALTERNARTMIVTCKWLDRFNSVHEGSRQVYVMDVK